MTGRRLFLILFLVLAFSSHASAASVPVIVQISPTANINTIAAAVGARVIDSIPGAYTYLLDVPLALPSSYTALLGIQWIELNTTVSLPNFALSRVVTVPGTTAADWYKAQPAWLSLRSGGALTYSTGRGVVVADINSWTDVSHPALRGHLTTGYDFVTSKPSGYTSMDQSEAGFLDQSEAGFLDQSEAGFLDQSEAGFLDQSEAGFLDDAGLNMLSPAYSHGTLCAGIIAAIAPDSMIMPLRTFDDNGNSDLFMIAKAIRYAADQGAQVINMSFGTLKPPKAIKSAIEYAQRKGVVLVASAGNRNTDEPQYPAAYRGVLTTAATDLLDKKGSFSNYNEYVFVSAPGVDIISAYPGGYYSIASGTSFSAPAVAGTAALVRSLRTTGVSDSIANGTVYIDSKNPKYAKQLGRGRIDVLRAVKPN